MASDKNVTDLVSAAAHMPGGNSAELYSDTAAQVCRRSLDELFSGNSCSLCTDYQFLKKNCDGCQYALV